MSLCFSIPFGDILLMAADGRGLNRNDSIGSNNLQKIFPINNRFLVFCCGLYTTNLRVIQQIKQIVEEKNITKVDDFIKVTTKVCCEVYEEFKIENPEYVTAWENKYLFRNTNLPDDNLATIINLTVSFYDEEKCSFGTAIFRKQIDREFEPDVSYDMIIFNGIKHEIAHKLFKKKMPDIYNLTSAMTVIKDLYKEIEKIESGLGGSINFYFLKEKGIIQYPSEEITHNVNNSDLTATHIDGSYSQMNGSGFKRHVAGEVKDYHYLTHIGTGATVGNYAWVTRAGYDAWVESTILTQVLPFTVTLPTAFKGKDFQIYVSTLYNQTSIENTSVTMFNWYYVTTGQVFDYIRREWVVDVLDKDIANGTFRIKAYVFVCYDHYPSAGQPVDYSRTKLRGLPFQYIVVA